MAQFEQGGSYDEYANTITATQLYIDSDDLTVDRIKVPGSGTYYKVQVNEDFMLHLQAGTRFKVIIDEDDVPFGEYYLSMTDQINYQLQDVSQKHHAYLLHDTSQLVVTLVAKQNLIIDADYGCLFTLIQLKLFK